MWEEWEQKAYAETYELLREYKHLIGVMNTENYKLNFNIKLFYSSHLQLQLIKSSDSYFYLNSFTAMSVLEKF